MKELTYLLAVLPYFGTAFSPGIFSPVRNHYSTKRRYDTSLPSQSSENEEDWRNFRAKLVMQYRNSDDTTSTLSSWAYESGMNIEKGSIILSRPLQDSVIENKDSGLAQQYFHKAIILVVDHEDSEFTRGILLNRPTNLILSDEDFVNSDGSPLEGTNSESQWKTWFGGEVNGILSDDPEIMCLHSLSYEGGDLEGKSEEILKGIKMSSLEHARELVRDGHAKATDFLTFLGYCGWNAGQLREELDNKSWYMVAADSKTVLDELKKNDASKELYDAGVDSWSTLMNMIGEDYKNDDGSFDDLMLREWTQERLLYPSEIDGEEQIDKFMSGAASSDSFGSEIGVGSVLRSSSLNSHNPFLLSDQEYHKSILLIIQDDDEMSIGVILNMPTSTFITIEFENEMQGTKKIVQIPERYGGRFSDGIDEDTLLWFHCNDILKEKSIGSPLGPEDAPIWNLSPDDASNAIATGEARAEDFLVVGGLSVWEKAPGGVAGGIRGEMNNNLFEVVDPKYVEDVWDALNQQEMTSPETIEENFSLIDLAWSECSSEDEIGSNTTSINIYDSDVTKDELADSALKRWMSAFMTDSE